IDATLSSRMAGQEDRLITDALSAAGVKGRTNVVQRAEDMIAERAANAKPLYDAARSFEVKDPRVLSVFEIPQFQQAYQRARAIAKLEGEELPDIFTYGPSHMGAAPITGVQAKSIPVGALDYVKRGMDDVIDSGMRGGGLGKPMASALRGKLKGMLGAVDELVPEYAQARGQYAGDSALMEAFDAGKGHFNLHPDEAAAAMKGMTEGEKDLYRKGAVEALAAKLESTPSRMDITKRRPLDSSTLDQKRLQLLFGDKFGAFQQSVADEVRMARGAQQVTGGSNTADKLADLADMAGVPIGEALSLLAGNPRPLLTKIVGQKLNARLQGMTAAKAEAAAPMLMAGKDEVVQNVLSAIRARQARDASVRSIAGRTGRGLGAAIAAASGVGGAW
ncbi:MAG TPA: hypothetical protein VKD22_05150, partial [Ramlibacter sp.]|nr:hypothetical protein [Ramlibacter sp.]